MSMDKVSKYNELAPKEYIFKILAIGDTVVAGKSNYRKFVLGVGGENVGDWSILLFPQQRHAVYAAMGKSPDEKTGEIQVDTDDIVGGVFRATLSYEEGKNGKTYPALSGFMPAEESEYDVPF